MSRITQILNSIEAGEECPAELLQPVYEELRRIAAGKLKNEQPGHTLQPTALVHEAWMRVMKSDGEHVWNHRGHFFAAAAEAMRRILIESARGKKRLMRGGGERPVSLDGIEIAIDVPVDELLAIDEVLEELAAADQQAAELVKLRYFSGFSTEQAAEVLGIPARSAYRDWQFARAWLHGRIQPDDD